MFKGPNEKDNWHTNIRREVDKLIKYIVLLYLKSLIDFYWIYFTWYEQSLHLRRGLPCTVFLCSSNSCLASAAKHYKYIYVTYGIRFPFFVLIASGVYIVGEKNFKWRAREKNKNEERKREENNIKKTGKKALKMNLFGL